MQHTQNPIWWGTREVQCLPTVLHNRGKCKNSAIYDIKHGRYCINTSVCSWFDKMFHIYLGFFELIRAMYEEELLPRGHFPGNWYTSGRWCRFPLWPKKLVDCEACLGYGWRWWHTRMINQSHHTGTCTIQDPHYIEIAHPNLHHAHWTIPSSRGRCRIQVWYEYLVDCWECLGCGSRWC